MLKSIDSLFFLENFFKTVPLESKLILIFFFLLLCFLLCFKIFKKAGEIVAYEKKKKELLKKLSE